MPSAPRPKGKAKRIQESILGKPQNSVKRDKVQKEINRRINYEEGSRIK